MEHRINWWWFGISRILCDLFGYFYSRTMRWRLLIKCQLCTYIYVTLTVFRHSHYGYCKQLCSVDYVIPYAWCCGQIDVYTSWWGCIHQHDTNRISGVYFGYIRLMVGGEFLGETVPTQLCPKILRNFNKRLCYYIWTGRIIWTFLFKFDYHLNLIEISYCCFCLFVFYYVIMNAIWVYSKFMCIRML